MLSRDDVARLEEEAVVIIVHKEYHLFLMPVERRIEALHLQLARDENDGSPDLGSKNRQKTRAAGEKRDFEWISASELLQGLKTSMKDSYGHDLRLLPAFEASLRSQLDSALQFIFFEHQTATTTATATPCVLHVETQNSSLHISGYKPGEEDELMKAFSGFGAIKEIIIHEDKSFAFVNYSNADDALNAFTSSQERPHHGCNWVVAFSHSDAPRKKRNRSVGNSDTAARKQHQNRQNRRGLGIGAPIAPWASPKLKAQVAKCHDLPSEVRDIAPSSEKEELVSLEVLANDHEACMHI